MPSSAQPQSQESRCPTFPGLAERCYSFFFLIKLSGLWYNQDSWKQGYHGAAWILDIEHNQLWKRTPVIFPYFFFLPVTEPDWRNLTHSESWKEHGFLFRNLSFLGIKTFRDFHDLHRSPIHLEKESNTVRTLICVLLHQWYVPTSLCFYLDIIGVIISNDFLLKCHSSISGMIKC